MSQSETNREGVASHSDQHSSLQIRYCKISDQRLKHEESLREEDLDGFSRSSNQSISEAGKPQLSWFHVPENNTKLIKKCINSVHGMGTLDVPNELNRAWPLYERPVRSVPQDIILPHSRFIEPACWKYSNNDDAGAMSIFLPYMNWEKYGNIQKTSLEHESSNTRTGNDRYIHRRRTLDQFYYSGLIDTRSRDAGQTVSKWTGDETGNKIDFNGRESAVPTSRLVMVDQLWLFVVNPMCILTFFPSHGHAESCTNLYMKVEAQAHKCEDAYDLAALITSQATMLIFDDEYRESADLFGIYQWAIGNKAARQTECFAALTQKSSSLTLDTNAEELKLILEVADILDELNMLGNILSKQEDVYRSILTTLSKWRPEKIQAQDPEARFNLHVTQEHSGQANFQIGARASGDALVHQVHSGVVNVSLDKNEVFVDKQMGIAGVGGAAFEKSRFELRLAMQIVERLRSAAKNTHEDVLSLLNLKQTAASLKESREATKQGMAVMLFTIVTIIFLPLSFFTSYFGQNISEYTGEDKNPTSAHLWKIGGPISAVIIMFSLVTAYFISYPAKKFWVRARISSPA